MNNVLTNQIDNIIKNNKQIRKEILKLQSKLSEGNNKLKNIEEVLQISIITCKNCHGSGEVSESCGYGGCSTEYYTCSKCEGKGYIIVEKS